MANRKREEYIKKCKRRALETVGVDERPQWYLFVPVTPESGMEIYGHYDSKEKLDKDILSECKDELSGSDERNHPKWRKDGVCYCRTCEYVQLDMPCIRAKVSCFAKFL